MDVITVDGKEYDPYFILDVTRDDPDKHISKSFREKVKKYHPDKYTDKEKKIKYEKYFKILSESYQYIKNKRSNKGDLSGSYKKTNKKQTVKKKTREDFEELNKSCDKKVELLDSNDFGYGENYKRMQKIEDYDNEDIVFCNQFDKKKFSISEFNRIFEYNQRNEDTDKVVSKALIHKTSDGFSGYNSGDLGSSALVSSFNGLLITGDDLGERGIGYWGNNFSDYKYSYKKSSKNPDKQIRVPENFKSKMKNEKFNENVEKKYSEYKTKYSNERIGKTGSFKNEQDILYKNTYDNLLEKEEYDKNLVMKYINQYDKETIKMALSGELDQTPTYMSTLKKYITKE